MKQRRKGSFSSPKKQIPTHLSSIAKVQISSQRSKVLRYFSAHKGTMLECAKATGIERANICRYVADLVSKGKVEKLYRGIDKTTKARAFYYGATEGKKGGAEC